MGTTIVLVTGNRRGHLGKGAKKMAQEYRLHLQIKRVENGQHLATSDDLPGLVVQGRTVAETVEIARDVARKLIESYREHGDVLPKGLQAMDAETVELDIPVGV